MSEYLGFLGRGFGGRVSGAGFQGHVTQNTQDTYRNTLEMSNSERLEMDAPPRRVVAAPPLCGEMKRPGLSRNARPGRRRCLEEGFCLFVCAGKDKSGKDFSKRKHGKMTGRG